MFSRSRVVALVTLATSFGAFFACGHSSSTSDSSDSCTAEAPDATAGSYDGAKDAPSEPDGAGDALSQPDGGGGVGVSCKDGGLDDRPGYCANLGAASPRTCVAADLTGGEANKQAFTATKADQSFTVPPGITNIRVKLWGAGGRYVSTRVRQREREFYGAFEVEGARTALRDPA